MRVFGGSRSIICGCEGRLRWYVCESWGLSDFCEVAQKSLNRDLELNYRVWCNKVRFGAF